MQPILTIGIIAIAIGMIIGVYCYNAGIDAGNRALTLARKMRDDMLAWIAINWKDEQTAYASGHRDGYEQGVAQSAELYERHDQ